MTPLTAFNTIENEFDRLSTEDQLSLVERLQRRISTTLTGSRDLCEEDLSAMAADPQVRREIDCFNADTLVAQADGLQGD